MTLMSQVRTAHSSCLPVYIMTPKCRIQTTSYLTKCQWIVIIQHTAITVKTNEEDYHIPTVCLLVQTLIQPQMVILCQFISLREVCRKLTEINSKSTSSQVSRMLAAAVRNKKTATGLQLVHTGILKQLETVWLHCHSVQHASMLSIHHPHLRVCRKLITRTKHLKAAGLWHEIANNSYDME